MTATIYTDNSCIEDYDVTARMVELLSDVWCEFNTWQRTHVELAKFSGQWSTPVLLAGTVLGGMFMSV